MHYSQSSFYLTTVLYVSGVTITHLQEHKTTVITASGNHYTVLLLSVAIVEKLELISVCCGWRVHLFMKTQTDQQVTCNTPKSVPTLPR
jgi:hypothetical protein